MQLTACPLCRSPKLEPILDRRDIPVFQNLPCLNQETARAIPRGDLALVECEECHFLFNAAFDPALVTYGAGYENAQDHSPAFQQHLDQRVAAILERGLRDATVVEVGCGAGHFLERLARAGNNRCIGFDPSYTGPQERLDGQVKIFAHHFDKSVRLEEVDAVVCRHVIEHIPQPREFLETLAKALAGYPHVQLFFETPCVEWILRHHQIWDFFYEHCSYFSADNLGALFAAVGFDNTCVNHVFGGQYLWVEASRSFAAVESGLLRQIRSHFREGQRTALWGAGAKGVTLANLLDPKGDQIDCLVDINPKKQGKFVPGTGHPIVAPEELIKRGVGTALLLNPNYKSECLQILKEAGANIELLTPLAPCD